MGVFSDWRSKLTPFDTELCVMIESLTGKPCELKPVNQNSFFVTVDYSSRNDVDFVNAIMNAVAGRVGKRLIRFDDRPDEKQFIAVVRFSSEKYPQVMRLENNCNPKPLFGLKYLDMRPGAKEGDFVFALEVDRERAGRMLSFVGNGEFEIPREGPATFHLLSELHYGTWLHAKEGDYVVFLHKIKLFTVIEKAIFQTNFEPIVDEDCIIF